MTINRTQDLPPTLSVYFNLLRFGCALIVLLAHACENTFYKASLIFPAHHAVIVFFVMSGYVIAHVAETKDRDLGAYALNRASRLWSVGIPALIFGLLVEVCAVPHAGVAIPYAVNAAPLSSALANLVFAGQNWFLDAVAPADPPYWSLNYEAWYYAIFGAAFFLAGRKRIPATILLCLIAGPKLMLLMPCWLAGVFIYRRRIALSPRASVALFAASLIAYVLFWRLNIQFMIRDRMEEAWPLIMVRLGGSNSFAGDYILTAIVAANFIALPGIAMAGRLLMPLKRLCAAAASCTLTLYLFHMPVLILLMSLYGRWDGWWRPLSILALLLAVMPLLALLTEHRLGEFRRLLRRAAMNIHALAGRIHGRTLLPYTPAE